MSIQVSFWKAFYCLILLPGVNIGSAQAHDFLSNARPRRNTDPKWYRGNPDFQSYYNFYNSIGHIEGLYEVDRIRMLYQQMRHLELTYGPDAASYQNLLGVQASTASPVASTQAPPPPTTAAPTTDPLVNAQKIYLCNPKDPLCKPQIVYLPTGAVPVLCDPRVHSACRAQTEKVKPAPAPTPAASPTPGKPETPAAPKGTSKEMEYDCDPYWDPDCLIDHPPQPVLQTAEPAGEEPVTEEEEEEVKAEESTPANPASAKKKSTYPLYDPYDFKRDLYDPFRYGEPAPEPQEEQG